MPIEKGCKAHHRDLEEWNIRASTRDGYRSLFRPLAA